jgi:hypothetical protein
MDEEQMMQQYGAEVSQRIDALADEEKTTLMEFMGTPAANIMAKVLGPDLVSVLPLDKMTQPNSANAGMPSPTGLASPTTPTEIPAEAAAPAAAPVRTGLAARPMQ